jgi:hypothetical protein
MKKAVFWDVALCRFCVNRRFGGTYRLFRVEKSASEAAATVSRWFPAIAIAISLKGKDIPVIGRRGP